MCGIAGIVGSGQHENIAVVKQMTRAMALRGPDGEGIWHEGPVFLGHRRLSIIDLEGGHQPMIVRRDGKNHVIVFNGEIYNHAAIRQRLLRGGVQCESRSDTEALLRLLMEREIPDALNETTGMFAFARWDPDHQRLVLARDRIGIKPLYYHHASDGILSFSSSLDSLTCNQNIERVMDMEALEYFLTLGYPPAPLTLYKGIYELPPGYYLVWENGKIEIQCYWKVDWNRKFKGTEDEAAEQLNGLLNEVVRDHLVSDVPVGAFLSGGIDSSSVVARASRQAGKDFETFTISFPDQQYDESSSARLVADHLKVRHSVIPMANLPVDESACRFTLQQIGQPFADSSCLPTYLVSQSASKKVKVVLSGDGGDELFAGYEDFDWGARICRAQSIPVWTRRLMVTLFTGMTPPPFLRHRSRQAKKGLSYSLLSREEMLIRLKSIIDPEELSNLTWLFEAGGPELSRLRSYLNEERSLEFTAALSRFLTEICLPGDMLRKVDSMSMAASIEVRVPLLDHRLVEFAQSLPVSMKVKGKVRKTLLCRAVKPDLPAEIFRNRKWGFSIPLHKTFDPSFLSFCRKTLTDPNSCVLRLFGKANIDRILSWNEADTNPVEHIWSTYTISHVLWMLIQLEMWCQEKRIALPVESFCRG
ncbi:MAG: asparagine synthase (glutamine-hydrolyzing) [Nitrospirae bacterium]|nr:asparagine synthase (glutamine-hydrolyzing) [Candidatus Manganitrophaceae bacterium]